MPATTPRWAARIAACVIAAGAGSVLAADTKTVGRVQVTTVEQGSTTAWNLVSDALETRFSPKSDHRFADRRLISLRPRWDDPTRFDATIYDYTAERGFDLVLDAAGNEISRRAIPDEPARAPSELADAYAIVRESPAYARAIAAGELRIYEAMPPVTVDALGRRLVNVGVTSPPAAGHPLTMNEIVSVHIPTGQIVHYPSGAPDTSRASLFACGPATSDCSASTGTCSYYQVVWPSSNPVWKLNVRHPLCTDSVQSDGTGLEITDVYFQGRYILKRGEMPVLNVQYANNTCGPYRDWLDSEDCFNAVGTDVPSTGSGIRVASSPPSTLCESGSDAGNFRGVAIFDQGDALWLVTETQAGWYRYVMEWRFHLDGSIEPIFGFGATSNNCTCNLHFHHAYWRLEWGVDSVLDGSPDNPAAGICTLEHHRESGTPDDFDPVATEASFVRSATDPAGDTFRVRNPITGNGYVIQPGAGDGTTAGDAYGKWDLTALALNANEIDDPNTNTTINVAPWVNGEAIGASKRLVTWYHATYTHDDPGGGGEACELVGPRIVPLNPCAATLAVDRAVYACSGTVKISVSDRDLAGSGTTTVSITSATETAGESVALTETPAGSGHFDGTIATTPGPPVTGDGAISVVDGDAIDVRYLDASSCGTPNVVVEKTAPIDCVAPMLSGVAWAVSGASATIDWSSSEPGTSVVHYGTSIPTGSTASAPGLVTSHEVSLTGLASCTTYYFWLETADAAGNVIASNGGGGYYALTTGQNVVQTYTSAGAPVPIPDNNPAGVASSIAVDATGTVQDADVRVNVTHTFDGNLVLSLITPAGAAIPLSIRRGGAGDNFTNTTFDDEAATPIASGTAPFTGSYRPDNPLSAVDGIAALGNWQLKAVDLAPHDTGTIDGWSLLLTIPSSTCSALPPPPPVPENGPGAGMTASRLGAAAGTIHLGWNATTCPARNYHLIYGSLASLPTYVVDGGVCGLGPLGGYDWVAPPPGDLWFVVAADDAQSKEGSWGQSAPGVERNGAVASGLCELPTRSNAGTCP